MIQTAWQEEPLKKEVSATSKFQLPKEFNKFSRWLFWGLIIGGFLVLALGGFFLYQYFVGKSINFSLEAPDHTLIGVPFNLKFNLYNNSQRPLKGIEVSMILPEGTALVSENPGKRVFSRQYGDLNPNGNLQDEIPLIVFSGEQSVKKFEITASYFPPSLGSKARFEMTKSIEVTAQEPAIKLDLSVPQKVLNNEDFEVDVNYQNISDFDFSNVGLEIQYPQQFIFNNSDPKPSAGNNFWQIGNLAKNSQAQSLALAGKVFGSEGSFFEIKASLKTEVAGQQYLISEKKATVTIAPSPLALKISLNDQPNYLVSPGDRLKYKISYRNNSDIGLNDAVIKAKLIGEMFNFRALRTSGFFDSKSKTIIFNVANTPDLRLLGPGAEGTAEFEIEASQTYPIKRISDKNFVLKVAAEISSPTVPYYVASDKTIGVANLENKVVGTINIGSAAVFTKGFSPPKVNKASLFTIHWIITNYSTDVRDIEIKAHLQSGGRFIGEAKSNVNSAPLYNERTGEIIWSIDYLPAAKGVVSQPAEASFQIEITPNITQISQPLPILSQTTLSAADEFTNVELKSSAENLETKSVVIP